MKKSNPALMGLLQALGVALYCGAIAALLQCGEKIIPNMPEFWGPATMLTLIVLSAAINGALIFGYPAYLAFNKDIARSIATFGYTVVYLFIILATVFAVMAFKNRNTQILSENIKLAPLAMIKHD